MSAGEETHSSESTELEKSAAEAVDASLDEGQDEDLAAQTAESARRLDELVKQERSSELVEVFHVLLGGPLTKSTWDELSRSVAILAGSQAMGIIAWIGQSDEDALRLGLKNYKLTPEAEALAVRIGTVFGAKITAALYKSDLPHDGHDWRVIKRRLSRNPALDAPVLSVTIMKNNGEEFMVQGDANSIARWARLMLNMLKGMGKSSQVSPRDAERLRDAMVEVDEWLEEAGKSSAEAVERAESSTS